ncbi:hypothetical protein K1719_033806 [Acacia pycnantha]|nr:hypothetical protein K1719_033806 [Acacia pycnantha]
MEICFKDVVATGYVVFMPRKHILSHEEAIDDEPINDHASKGEGVLLGNPSPSSFQSLAFSHYNVPDFQGLGLSLIKLLDSSTMEGDRYNDSNNNNGTHHHQEIDGKMLHTFKKNFVQVQNILDQNRLLINEINQNHESKVADNLSRNVGLIKELNSNIRKVVDLYSDLSTSFSKSMDVSSEGDSSGAVKSSDAKGGLKRLRPT